jgi:cysteine-rich repeat protein
VPRDDSIYSSYMHTGRWLLLALASLLIVHCSTGDVPPVRDMKKLDKDRRDTRVPDVAPPADHGPPDTVAWPDHPKPDKPGPKPDSGPCGNKKVDTGETCDKAIAAGQVGACPLTAADCDDKNKCTTDTLVGSAATCTAACDHAPIAGCCGNGIKETGEECDDGNIVDKDGCTNTCKLPGGHLLITEVAISPSEAEFIEIYNPSTQIVALDNVYVTDRTDYFKITNSSLTSGSTDFVARFPTGAKINPGQYIVIAVQSLDYKTAYGKAPDYELSNSEVVVPDMVSPATGYIGSQVGLTDTGEVIVLFTWDGKTDLIKDIDYVVWKSSSASAVYKNSSICIDGPDTDTTPTCYLDDTVVTNQFSLQPPSQGGSLHRCDYTEGTEKKTGGNGASGHDETSEPFDLAGATWKRNPNTLKDRTPAAPAPVGFCPI